MTIWTAEMVSEMRRLASLGHRQKSVARAFGVYPNALRSAAHRHGVNFRSLHAETRNLDTLVSSYVDEGLSTYQIAARCERHPRTVARWLKAAGVEMRPSFGEQ